MIKINKLLLALLFSTVIHNSSAVTITVTNTNDQGPGSLRQALISALTPGPSYVINFNIPSSDPGFNSVMGIWMISPLTTLPYIVNGNVIIDGTSQTLNQGNTNANGPEIMIYGGGNVDFAFHIFNSSNNIITGLTISKFIKGIQVSGNNARNNIIRGNYIGTNYNATDTLGNYIGIEIIGGPKKNFIGGYTANYRNIVSGNNHIGIRIVNSDSNTIANNYVGTDRSGTFALRNYDGISIEGTSKFNIIGSYSSNGRNLVSGNVAYGIPVFGAGCNNNIIIGNYIGTDITGSVAIPNTYGVLFDDGACYNMLGGKKIGATNLISGNSGYGVFIYNNSTNSDTVVGNLIGTNHSGLGSLPNSNGLVIDGIPKYHIIDSNVISGNSQNGIVIHATGTNENIITRNCIGTDFSGSIAIPNNFDGIRIGEGPRQNKIGGLPDKGNIIANNGGNGITIMNDGDYYNKVSGNSIFSNQGIGIDLYPPGVTLNDAGDTDNGPNFGMNFPVITQAYYNTLSGNFVVEGYIDSGMPQNISIELFKSDNDISGYGEGIQYLTSVTPDVSGNFNVVIVQGISGGDKITATATDALGNSSEFSASSLVSGIEKENPDLCIFNFSQNPAFDMIYITFRHAVCQAKISVLSINGQELRKLNFNNPLPAETVEISVSGLNPGVYLLHVEANSKVGCKKFIKK